MNIKKFVREVQKPVVLINNPHKTPLYIQLTPLAI